MTTIGGVAFRHLDRLPHIGDRVVIDDIALTVLEMDAHRISRVRVAKVSAEEDFEELSEEQQQELTQEMDQAPDRSASVEGSVDYSSSDRDAQTQDPEEAKHQDPSRMTG